MATLVGERLNTVVQPCFLELADPPIAQAIDDCVRAGFRRIVALPLLLGAAGHQKNDIPVALNQARARYPDLDIRYGAPLGVQYTIPPGSRRANRSGVCVCRCNHSPRKDGAGAYRARE
jgi:sirohydrochlorin cobaltochelatase